MWNTGWIFIQLQTESRKPELFDDDERTESAHVQFGGRTGGLNMLAKEPHFFVVEQDLEPVADADSRRAPSLF